MIFKVLIANLLTIYQNICKSLNIL